MATQRLSRARAGLSRLSLGCRSLVMLLLVDLALAVWSLGRVLAWTERWVTRHQRSGRRRHKVDLGELRETFGRAAQLYPRRTVCLERALALFFVTRHCGWTCTFYIGARKYPFQSHAWVEVERAVIVTTADDDMGETDLTKVLAPVYRLECPQ